MKEGNDHVVDSPCVRNCCLNDHDICLGCFRSLPEICAWAEASNATRLEIIERTRQRQAQMQRETQVPR